MSIKIDKKNNLNTAASPEEKITSVASFNVDPTSKVYPRLKTSQAEHLRKKIVELSPSITEKNKHIFYAHMFHLQKAVNYILSVIKESVPTKFSNSFDNEKKTHVWKDMNGTDMSEKVSYQFDALEWETFNHFILASLGVNRFSPEILPYTTRGIENFKNNFLARKIDGKEFTFHMNTAILGYGIQNQKGKSHSRNKNENIRRNTIPFKCGLISYFDALKNVTEPWAKESISKINRFYNKEGSTPIWCKFEWALKNYFETIILDGKKWNANLKWKYNESKKFQIQITLYSMKKPKSIVKDTTVPKITMKSEASQTSEEKKDSSETPVETYASKLKKGKKTTKKVSIKEEVEVISSEEKQEITPESIVSALSTPEVSIPESKGAPKKKKKTTEVSKADLKSAKEDLSSKLANL